MIERRTGTHICQIGFADPRRGFAGEAMTAAHAWADEERSRPRWSCITDPEHGASERIAGKPGHRRAGLYRSKGRETLAMERRRSLPGR